MNAIILAGGLGTRLQSVVTGLPKPLAPVAGKPFLSYLLSYLRRWGVDRFILSVGYKAETIENAFGEAFAGAPIVYAREQEPLGTGGALRYSLTLGRENSVLVCNGDTFFAADPIALAKLHQKRHADVTIALKPLCGSERYGRIELGTDGQVLRFVEKGRLTEGLINGGMYIVRRDLLQAADAPAKFSFEAYLEANASSLSVYGCAFDSYFIDIGVPEDYARAARELPGIA
jgi:D-glycero-alpha-D-manno-heptose 1-phosphate guanylyltransferase